MTAVRRPSSALYGLHDGLASVQARRAEAALSAGNVALTASHYAAAARHWRAAARIAKSRKLPTHTASIAEMHATARSSRSLQLA